MNGAPDNKVQYASSMAQQIIPQSIVDSFPKQIGTRTSGSGKMTGVDTIDFSGFGVTPLYGGSPMSMGGQFIDKYVKKVDIPNLPKTDFIGNPMPEFQAVYNAQSGVLEKFEPVFPYAISRDTYSSPQIDPSGRLLDPSFRSADAGEGGISGFLKNIVKDYGPMIAASLGANYLNSSGLLSGASAGANAVPTVSAVNPLAGMGTGQAGVAATSAATGLSALSLGSQIANQGLVPSLLTKVADFTGIKSDTLGQLGVAGVQALLSGYGASQQADAAKEAAQTQADAITRAAQIAADAAKFRPVGVTTRFGQSAFTTDAQGNVIGAGYTPSAEIKGYQDRLSALAGQGLSQVEGAQAAYQPLTGAAQSLFNLGRGYLANSPEQAAQDYITKQQALLAPTQENQLALLQNKLFQQGRGGAATAQGGNLMATSPEMAAYYNSIAQSNLALAAQADQEARNRITYGAGLFDTGAGLQSKYYSGQTAAYQPFATAMEATTGLESLAERPMNLGTSIGAKTTAGASQAGSLLSQGITSAATTMYPSNAFSTSGNVLTGLGQSPVAQNAINSLFGVQPQQTGFTDADKLRLFKSIYGV